LVVGRWPATRRKKLACYTGARWNLANKVMNLRVSRIASISRIGEQLLAPQGRLCSKELIQFSGLWFRRYFSERI